MCGMKRVLHKYGITIITTKYVKPYKIIVYDFVLKDCYSLNWQTSPYFIILNLIIGLFSRIGRKWMIVIGNFIAVIGFVTGTALTYTAGKYWSFLKIAQTKYARNKFEMTEY